MSARPNVLWIMSDQHNANCTSYMGHPNVITPGLDRVAARGVNFTNAFANNPICSPSRICFITGQYVRNHQMLGNNHAEFPESNPETLACLFRKYGYQTAMFGKSHMVRRWDEEGFEVIKYTDLCDASRDDPFTTHYFKYLDDLGLADKYEEGSPGKGHEYARDGSVPALLPYEHSIEHYTGETTLDFLNNRDQNRPFFVKMSFQRPHEPITPAPEYFDKYNPDDMVLPENSSDYFEHRFKSKPEYQQRYGETGGEYPLADPDPKRLKRCLASYYALINQMDDQISRVLDWLEENDQLENTIIFYTADHGDFAGEHGLFHKNFGIYDSVQRIPYLLSWPGGPQGKKCDDIVESVDWYTTLCNLCDVPSHENRDGIDLVRMVDDPQVAKGAAYCEWYWNHGKVMAVREKEWRLVYYHTGFGELYHNAKDPGEMVNLWNDPQYADEQKRLMEKLFTFCMGFSTFTDPCSDEVLSQLKVNSPTTLIHQRQHLWSELKETYNKETVWQGH